MPELRLSPRGVIRKDWKIEVRDLTKADLAVLAQPRAKPGAAKRFRDPHHKLAKLLAFGLRLKDAALKAGYSATRAAQLNDDPAFRELVAKYSTTLTEKFDEAAEDFVDFAYGNMIKAERQISDRLDAADEDDELLPVRDLIAISRDAADRLGFGKKQTNVNVNVDFAAQLEQRMKRAKTLEIARVDSSPSLQSAGDRMTSAASDPPLLSGELIRRRA